MAFKPIQIIINAKDEASSVLAGINGKLTALAGTIAAYFGARSFIGAVEGAADLESAISRVAAAADGGAGELQALRDAAEAAGRNTTYTAVEAAGALENLVKAGLSAKDAIAALPATMALAQAGDISLAQSAEVVTKAMAGMGLQVQDTARIADVLAKGANATNTSVDGLSLALSYVAPSAKSANVSLEGTVALLGKMADSGIDASRAGTSLSSMLAQFSDPASSFRRELAAIGITTGNFETALHQLAAAGGKGEKAILAVGLNAGPGLRALINQGMPALDALKTGLLNAEGSAAATAATMSNNLKGAMAQLGAVWNSVTNALTSPVLPVLKDGVDQLTGALRGAIADGTVAKFGAAIKTAFEGGITWVKNFAASFDWDATSAKLQAFASDLQAKFTQIGQWASNASAVVQTAWGVMSAGAQGVLGAIYAIGSAFSGIAAGINSGAAVIADGLAKITFGDVSARFKAMADGFRDEAGALNAVSQELSDKANAAAQATVDGAEMARAGWAKLTAEADNSATAMAGTASAATKAGTAAEQAATKAAQASTKQTEAAEAARQKVADLRAEYQQAIDTGSIQRAAEIMQDLKRATAGAATAMGGLGQSAEDAAKLTAAAFERAGIQTKEQLADAARLARQDFELIKNSGQATADGIQQAWKSAADAAIAASGGVVPAWVQAEAAARGYVIQTDEAGRKTLEAAQKVRQATSNMATGWGGVSSAASQATASMTQYFQKMADSQKVGQSEANRFTEGRTASNGEELGKGVLEIGSSGHYVNAQSMASDAKGNAITMGRQNWLSIFNLVKGMGLTEEQARQIAGKAYDVNTGQYLQTLQREQKRGTWDSIDVTEAARRAAEAILRKGSGALAVNDSSDASGTSSSTSTKYVTNITVGGVKRSIKTADAASAQALKDVISQLADAKGVAI